ncbi:MarR family winged helix-turn-helix transcriptional regulator [Actinomadura sp. DC4]|uniref:MarR family winged helix-turn-helix transcriptional regulator n=1 Tax=Actinomadura sp. DC4 TaxID=3055069 RepID=UPI0025B05163|nr:MarR family winged helix-turn-helix transcriptional regulator [Actinomadura sp. DC4]MDN3358235.1 MarR family winged helix-turn-helix transcriptional regulator [Actinomadura sp. DC4]
MRHEGVRDEVDAFVPGWGAEMPPEAVAAVEFSKRVSRIGGLFEQAIRAELAELGLTYAEFDVLVALRRVGEPYHLTPSELSRSLFLTSGGISNVLQRLTGVGYVERGANPGDRRSRWVRLTEEGLEVAGKALDASARAHREVLSGVPPEAVRNAADALREVLAIVGRRSR